MNFQRILNLRFTKLLEEHRIPTNSDINERLLTGRFGANGTSLGVSMYEQVFIFRSNCEFLNLPNVFHHKIFFGFFSY